MKTGHANNNDYLFIIKWGMFGIEWTKVDVHKNISVILTRAKFGWLDDWGQSISKITSFVFYCQFAVVNKCQRCSQKGTVVNQWLGRWQSRLPERRLARMVHTGPGSNARRNLLFKTIRITECVYSAHLGEHMVPGCWAYQVDHVYLFMEKIFVDGSFSNAPWSTTIVVALRSIGFRWQWISLLGD